MKVAMIKTGENFSFKCQEQTRNKTSWGLLHLQQENILVFTENL